MQAVVTTSQGPTAICLDELVHPLPLAPGVWEPPHDEWYYYRLLQSAKGDRRVPKGVKGIGELAFMEMHSWVSRETEKQLRAKGLKHSAKVISWSAWRNLGEMFSVEEWGREEHAEKAQEMIEFMTNAFAAIDA